MNIISIILLSVVVILFIYAAYRQMKGRNSKGCCNGCSGDCMSCNKKITGKI